MRQRRLVRVGEVEDGARHSCLRRGGGAQEKHRFRLLSVEIIQRDPAEDKKALEGHRSVDAWSDLLHLFHLLSHRDMLVEDGNERGSKPEARFVDGRLMN